jgi:hypothetical protein
MGGAISMVSKNWRLFGAGLSSFWRWAEQKILIGFPPEQKKRGKRMDRTPYARAVARVVARVVAVALADIASPAATS